MEYKTIGNVQLQPVVLESKGLPLRLELEEVIFFSHIHPKITTLMIDELNEDGAIARFLNNRLNYLSNSKLHKPDDYAKLRENPLYIVREHPNECPLTLDMISPDEERIGTKFLKWVEEFKKSSLTYLKEKKIRVPIFSPFMGQGAYGTIVTDLNN